MGSAKQILFILSLICLLGCQKAVPKSPEEVSDFVMAADLSSLPEITTYQPVFYDANGSPADCLSILQQSGVNTVRLRLWVNPANGYSSLSSVQTFAKTLQARGFRIWLTLHYSDSWADPLHQVTPKTWQGLPLSVLKDSVYQYTKQVVSNIQPNYIQIGNEINSGFLHPAGHIINNPQQFLQLLASGCAAVRASGTSTKIMLHFAGLDNADWFYDLVKGIDYDVIGLSYYPIWHGKSLQRLQSTLQTLKQKYNKTMMIAETAYPFTLQWNDWTNNIVGEENQLILPDFPATAEGQRSFIRQIKTIVRATNGGIGFCYWGGELIAWKGNQSADASVWENQALFDFKQKALPVLKEFAKE